MIQSYSLHYSCGCPYNARYKKESIKTQSSLSIIYSIFNFFSHAKTLLSFHMELQRKPALKRHLFILYIRLYTSHQTIELIYMLSHIVLNFSMVGKAKYCFILQFIVHRCVSFVFRTMFIKQKRKICL